MTAIERQCERPTHTIFEKTYKKWVFEAHGTDDMDSCTDVCRHSHTMQAALSKLLLVNAESLTIATMWRAVDTACVRTISQTKLAVMTLRTRRAW